MASRGSSRPVSAPPLEPTQTQQGAINKSKRRRPNTACAECRKSHFKCEGVPPCQQCRRKGVKCYFPVGSVEKIRMLEEAVAGLKNEVEFHKSQALLAENRYTILISWWDLTNKQMGPTPKKSWFSHRYLQAAKCFQSMALLSTELIVNPDQKDVIIPQLFELEKSVLGDRRDGEVIYLTRALITYNHLAQIFYTAKHLDWAQIYADKLDQIILDSFPLLPMIDQELLSNSTQISAVIKTEINNRATANLLLQQQQQSHIVQIQPLPNYQLLQMQQPQQLPHSGDMVFEIMPPLRQHNQLTPSVHSSFHRYNPTSRHTFNGNVMIPTPVISES